MVETIDSTFRDFNTPGNPGSGEYKPEKPRIRALLKQIQAAGGLTVTRNTLAQLNAVTPPTENYMGIVLNDPNPANNGYYARQSGAWVRGRGFPDTFARVVLSGSANAQVGGVSTGVNPADIEAFFAVVVTDNTGPMTLSISGEAPRPVVNLAGNPLAAGEWTGVVMFFLNGSGQYQLMLDAGSAASAAQSATEAGEARDDAVSIFDNFDARYLGAHPSDPSLDNQGDPLIEGALYWNSTDGVMRAYHEGSWQSQSIALNDGDVTRPKVFTHFERSIPFNIREFGAFGNDDEGSLVDETAQIQAAISAANSQGRRLIVPGTHYLCGLVGLSTPFKLRIEGDPQNPPVFHGTPETASVNSADLFKFVRSTYDVAAGVITVAADIRPYDKTFSLSTVAGLAEGMVIELSSNALWHYDHRNVYYKGEMHVITRVMEGTNEIELYDRARDFYSVSGETLTIRAWWPDRFSMSDIEFDMPAPSPSVGNTCLDVDRAMNPEYNNIRVRGSTFVGIMNTRSINARYYNPELYRIGRYLGGTSSAGYGIADRATVGSQIVGLKSHGMRRAVDFHTVAGGSPARDFVVEAFEVNGGGTTVEGDEWYPEGASPNYGLGMHVCEDGEFRNGRVADVETGINIRSRNIDVKNVKFRGRMVDCIHLSYGTGSFIDGNSYMREDFPDKLSVANLDPTDLPRSFVRTSSSGAESVWHYDSPLVITNNVAFGLQESFMNFGANATVVAANMNVTGNEAHVRTGSDRPFYFFMTHLGNAGRIVSSVIGPNRIVDAGDGTALMYESDLSANIGYISSGGGNGRGVVEVGAREYVAILGDDQAMVIPNAAMVAGDRVMLWVTTNGGATNAIFTIAPGSTTTDVVGGTLPALIQARNDAPFTDGASGGTDGMLQFGLTSGGDLWVKNRVGQGRRTHIKIL